MKYFGFFPKAFVIPSLRPIRNAANRRGRLTSESDLRGCSIVYVVHALARKKKKKEKKPTREKPVPKIKHDVVTVGECENPVIRRRLRLGVENAPYVFGSVREEGPREITVKIFGRTFRRNEPERGTAVKEVLAVNKLFTVKINYCRKVLDLKS